MKKLIFSLFLFLFTLPTLAAEKVDCTDPSGAWTVDFNLDGKLVSGLRFTFLGQLTASYPLIKASVNQVQGKTYYDLILSHTDFFDFNRVNGSSHFNGGFFITANPTGLETNVTCDAH